MRFALSEKEFHEIRNERPHLFFFAADHKHRTLGCSTKNIKTAFEEITRRPGEIVLIANQAQADAIWKYENKHCRGVLGRITYEKALEIWKEAKQED